jgi:PAS domain S-box-containing protein
MNDSAKTKSALLEEVRALRQRTAELEGSQRRFAFLAEASSILAASLDYATTLRSIAQLAVPRVADWCTVDLVTADGSLERLAVAHVDPEKVSWAYELQRRYPPDPNSTTGIYRVLRTRKTEFYANITDDMLAATARDQAQLHMLRTVGFTSAIIVPLVAREQTLGAITFVSAESGRHYGLEDLALAEAFASRAAVEIDNARLYQEVNEQREWLRVSLASIGDAVIITNPQGQITFMNTVAEGLTGWTGGTAIGAELHSVFQIIDEITRAPIAHIVDTVIREGVVIGLGNDTLLITHDGAEIPIDDSAAPIRNDRAAIIGVVLIFRDVTERRRAAARLRESRDQIAAILRGVDDGITVQDPTGRLIYANDTAAQLCGYPSAEALLQTPLADLMRRFTLMDEKGEPFPPNQLPGRLVLEGQPAPAQVMRFRALASGEERWSIVKATPVNNDQGQITFAINTFHDITFIKQAEAALREQRELLAVTLSSIGDAVITTDVRGAISFMNPVAEALTGWTSAQAQGLDLTAVFQIINEQTRQPVESPAMRVLRDGVVVGLANHTILIARDGSEHPIDDSGAPIRNADDQMIGVVLVFRDITERKQAEDTLRASEARYRTLVEVIPQITWILAPDGTMNYMNQRWEEYTGQPGEIIQSMGWMQMLHPDDRAHVAATRASGIEAGEAYELEVRMRRFDGNYRWHLVRVAPVQDHGRILAWTGTATDIHDLKQAEESQRFLAEASNMLVESLDYETTLQNVAQLAVPSIADWCAIHLLEADGAIRRLAVAHVDSKRAELAYQRPARYPLSPEARHIVPHVLRSGQPELYAEVSDGLLAEAARNAEHLALLRALGVQSYMCVPLRVNQRTLGTITLALADSQRRYSSSDLALAEDLARRAALAVENARLYRAAQDAIRLRDQFLSIASHELKTPLTTLLGNAQMLQRRAIREGTSTERDQRALRVIAEQASRLNRMIAALLDISRIETGQLSIERKRFDLCELARRVVEEVQPSLHQHSLECHDHGQALIVDGDELRLEQVLQNLLQNAIKYSPAGGPIAVRVEQREQMACMSVTDRGIGIPASELPNLFQRFYRAGNVDEQHISGLGVGLYVVKEIAALHNGTVTVTSQEGQGSTFSICLPLAADSQE